MKIKSSKESAKSKYLLYFFPVSALIFFILRCVQTRINIDASTGFYKSGSALTVIFYALAVASIAVLCVYSYVSKDACEIAPHTVKSRSLAIVTILFAAAMVYDMFYSFVLAADKLGSTGGLYYGEENTVKAMMSSGSLFISIRAIFALLSAVYLFILASSFLGGDGKASKHKVLALAPVCWACFRLLALFVKKISFLRVSDLFLDLVMLCFMIVFFMAFAQVNSGVYSDGFSWKIIAYGLSSALVAAGTNLSRLVFTLYNKEQFVNAEHPFSLIDLVFAAFVFVLVLECIKQKKPLALESETDAQPKEIGEQSED